MSFWDTIERLLKIAPRKNVMCISREELMGHSATAYRDVPSAQTADPTTLRSLYSGTAASLAVQVGGAALAFAAQLILARLLRPTGYGTYALAFTWAATLCTLALAGQNNAVLRFIPRYIHDGRWRELRGLRIGAHTLVFAAAAALAVAGALTVLFAGARIGTALRQTLWAGFALLPVLALLQLSGALHRGLKRPASSGVYYSILRPALLILVVVIWSSTIGHLSPQEAMEASIVAALAALVCSEWALGAAWPAAARQASPRFEKRAWFSLGRQLFFMSVIEVLLGRADVLILGGVAPSKTVGAYFAAVQLGSVAAYGLAAANTIMAPLIAEHYAAGDTAGLQRLTRRAALMTFAITMGIVLPASVLGRVLLGLFGKGFEAAYVPLLIVLAGQCVNALCGPVGYLLTMTRFEHRAPVIFGGAACLNVALNLLLAPRYGMFGAAIATAVSTATWNLAALAYVWKRLGINPTIFGLGRNAFRAAPGKERNLP